MSTFKTLIAEFLVSHLNLPEAAEYDGAKWEPFQLAHLNSTARMRIEVKSRQIAWSFLTAAEAVADAVLNKKSSLFISINLSESQEKIRYARRIYENIEGIRLPHITRNNQLGIEFSNGARVLSLFSPRGKPGFNVYFDEYAHFQYDRKQYQAALPVITKGGRFRIGSSPMGARGIFWEIFKEPIKQYRHYERRESPWWSTFSFCTDPLTAIKDAPEMPTAERVERFGTDIIKVIFESMVLEDFQQEYECQFVDESASWITWDEIASNTVSDLKCVVASASGVDMVTPRIAIKKLLGMIQRGEIEAALAGGVDVGRKRDATEIILGGQPINSTQYPVRFCLTLRGMPFPEQQALLEMIVDELPVHTLLIDRNGIGMQLAEHMDAYSSGKARGVDFGLQTKRLWATNAKMRIQKHQTPLPNDRDLKYQIHSIKRKITAGNNMTFDAERSEKHHADKFWAWALMLEALTEGALVVPDTAIRSL